MLKLSCVFKGWPPAQVACASVIFSTLFLSQAFAQRLMVTIPSGAAPLSAPQAVAFDRAGNLFIADSNNAQIKRIDKASGIVETVAGTGIAGVTGDGGVAKDATLMCPTSLVFNAVGELFIADTCANHVRKISPITADKLITRDNGALINNVAGDGGVGQVIDGAVAKMTNVARPEALALDSGGNLFLVSVDPVAFSQTIRRVDALSGIITTTPYFQDTSVFSQITDSFGDLLIGWSNGIGLVTSNSGAPLTGGEVLDGTVVSAMPFVGTSGSFRPIGFAFDSAGDLYVTNLFAAPDSPNWIYQVTPGTTNVIGSTGTTVTPFAGLSMSLADPPDALGYSGDGGPPLLAKMNNPQGLAVDSADNLYIADTGNNVIRAVIKGAQTPTGSPSVIPLDQHGAQASASVTFAGGVSAAGVTAVVVSSSGPNVPANFKLSGDNLYFDIVTTAVYTAPLTVCLSASAIPANAHIGHLNQVTNLWEDLIPTSSSATQICASVNSLSPFAILVPVSQNQAPAFTSGAAATFQVGTSGNFVVSASGTPKPTLSEAGALPTGLSFDSQSGILSGTPATSGVFPLTFSASNGIGTAVAQNFTLTVDAAPAITSATSATFTQGLPANFIITASGFPAPNLLAGSLPAGLAIQDHGDGTATISGTPSNAGDFSIVISASNGVGAVATQSLILHIVAGSGSSSLSVTPSAIDFGAWRFPHVATATVSVRNTGQAVVNISGVHLQPAAGTPRDSFLYLSTCGSHLASGKTCSIYVAYLTLQVGSQSATLTIADDVPNSPQVIILKGKTLK